MALPTTDLDDELLAKVDRLEDENAKLRAEVDELRKTIEQMSDYAVDANDALKRAEECRVAGLKAAERASR